jgi:DNA-directed RNA polymerase II subunit RPB2
MIDDKCIQTLLNQYFNQENILVNHQILSYNDYIDNILPSILSQFFPISINVNKTHKIQKITLSIENMKIDEPYFTENNGCRKIMTPNIARLRNYTYSLVVIISVRISISILNDDIVVNIPDKIIPNVILGKIPILVKSKYCVSKNDIFSECKYDTGGYCIINGNEKVLITQEKVIPNKIQVYKNSKNNSKYSYLSEVRSCNVDIFGPTKSISIKLSNSKNKNNIYIAIPRVKQDLPLFIIFKALGCLTDKEIIYMIIDNDGSDLDKRMIQLLKPCIEESSEYTTENDAIKYISKYINHINNSFNNDLKFNYCKSILNKEYLPHLKDSISKLYFTGLMVNKLLKCYLGINPNSDRDSYENKRMETCGMLLGNLTFQCMNRIVKDIKTHINKELSSGIWSINNNYEDIINENNISKIIKPNYIESILKGALATGNWGLKSNINKQGVSQVLNRLTFMSTLSHLRRISTPIDNTGKLIPPRKLHNTQWGYVCPTETPEGQSVGVVKNLAMNCEITLHILSERIIILIQEYIIPLKELNIFEINKLDYVKLFINGEWIGFTDQPVELNDYFKVTRMDGLIHPHCSIYWNITEYSIHIYTDRGRCIRPLIKNNENLKNITIDYLKKHSWDDYILSDNNYHFIEYIDIHEVNTVLISNSYQDNPKFTHFEIHPSLILGALASCIPFLNHNQSPRNTYQSAMGKQAVGIHTTNYNKRFDTFSHILYYPQKPLINTRMMKYFNFNSMPNGINAIIAIATYTGYNQEDSVIINQSAIDRGLFSSTFYRCYKDEEQKNQLTGDEDIFCKPDTEKLLFPKPCDYSKLSSDGFVPINTKINENDIIIGKVMPLKNNPDFKYKDSSTSVRTNEKGYIDNNYIDTNGEGYRFCKVKVRTTKIPEIGDKFSSRHGQKGTVGITYSQNDMPFTSNGIVPDIIINPHAIPSRMTIAQLIECILGKSCSILGYEGDGTGFNNTNVNDLISILEKCGYDGTGNEILYNGITGEQMNTQIFMGPTYYQRLKHMSSDKIHSRAGGPIVSMTRQPAEGRSSHGGLRFGEMERDCMIAHGSSYFLKERLMDVSDKFKVYICNQCKIISPGNPNNNTYECKACKNYGDFTKVYLPYSCKLLLHELMSMSLGPRLLTN